MRAHTITTMTWPTPKACKRAVALVLAVCAFAIPASASAQGDYSMPNAITGGSATSSQPVGGSGYSSVNAVTPPSSESSSASGSQHASSGYSSLNAINGPNARSSRTPTELAQRVTTPVAPDATSAATDPSGFDWGDAALGAGAALALLALGGTVFLTVRRRPTVSPTTPSSS